MKLLVPISSLMYLHVYSFFKNSDQCEVKSVRSDAKIDEKEYYFFWDPELHVASAEWTATIKFTAI